MRRYLTIGGRLSRAVSDDPERNGISRLDEMMSGAVRSILRSSSLFPLLYSYIAYVITDCRCDSAEFSLDTDWIVYVAGFYSQLASKVIRTGSVQVVVYLERHVVLFEYFVSLYIYNNQTTSIENCRKLLWDQQKESRWKIRHQRGKANLQKGSRFHKFCRRNNLRLKFKEYISDKPIISFQNNKKPIPKHWKIRNINQRFIIKKLLTTTYNKGKYYKLEIEVKDRFQHLAPLDQAQYKELLRNLEPWKQLHTKLKSKYYHILPNVLYFRE